MDSQAFEALRLLINPVDVYRADDPAATTPDTPAAQLAQQTLQNAAATLLPESTIHRNLEPTAAQQYLTLEAQANADFVNPPEPQKDDDVAQSLALQMLLAQNGSLFNGAVGGVNGTGQDTDTRAALAALREQKRQLNRRETRILGISQTDIDLGLSDQNADEEDDAFFAGVLSQTLEIPADNYGIYDPVDGYSSFQDRSGGLIS